MLFGIDWLETNGAVWDLRRGQLYMKGLVHALKPNTNGGWIHRVIVQEMVELPARCKTDVPGWVMYKDLKDPVVTWVSVPGAPVEEVRVARTILPFSCEGVPVRVINLASYPVTLRRGMVLGDLEPVEVERGPRTVSGPEVDIEGGLPAHVQTLLER